MTLRQLNTVLRADELTSAESPRTRIVALLAVLRSLDQGETATDEGVGASMEKFIEQFGAITTESVDLFMRMPPEVLDQDIPDDAVLAMISPAMNPAEMSDAELSAFHDAFLVLHILDDDGVYPAFKAAQALPPDKQDELRDTVDAEIDKRANAASAALVAHTIEQNDAAEADKKPRDRMRIMSHRAARLLKLLSLNAPEVIIENQLAVLART